MSKYLVVEHFENNLHNNDEYRLYEDKSQAIAKARKDFENMLNSIKREHKCTEKAFDYVERGYDAFGFGLYDKHFFGIEVVELKNNKANHFGCSGW